MNGGSICEGCGDIRHYTSHVEGIPQVAVLEFTRDIVTSAER
jgi:hypothetical protein